MTLITRKDRKELQRLACTSSPSHRLPRPQRQPRIPNLADPPMDSGVRAFLDVIAEMAADAVLANRRKTKERQGGSDYYFREINRSEVRGRMAARIRLRCFQRAKIQSAFENHSSARKENRKENSMNIKTNSLERGE